MIARRIVIAGALLAIAAGPAASEEMAAMGPPVMDDRVFVHALFDQFEARVGGSGPAFRWEGEGWAGTDYDKLWIKTEGIAQDSGRVEDGRDEILYDRAVSTYFDVQAGVRSDLDSGTGRTWAALGIEGLAPFFLDVQAAIYASDRGHLAARFEASYDLLLAQRLILQPQIELDVYSKPDPGRGVGSGADDLDTGLRLRYEISRKLAPYLGVVYEGKFGTAAGLARRAGDRADDVRFVFGIRSWL